MNMNQFAAIHPGHPLSNAYGLMKNSRINAEKRDFCLMARAMIELLKYQGELTDADADALFDDVDSHAMGGNKKRTLQ